MTYTAPSYRWSTSAAAEAFDQAAEFIHPFYLAIQDLVLAELPFAADAALLVVDLGGGSGRLIERVLQRFPNARAVLVDQSEPFLALAERRLKRFGKRAQLVKRRLQDDWRADLSDRPQAFVSMSAIHHLDPGEKQSLFARCHDALADGGIFINGDEFRPESDADYLTQLEWWVGQKTAAEKRGQIPASFKPMFDAWYDRNVRRFGEPKHSGDDCHETIATQLGYLRNAGFARTNVLWADRLWAVVDGLRSALA
jgi:tRNA (cmo5U34)-methyltransferase